MALRPCRAAVRYRQPVLLLRFREVRGRARVLPLELFSTAFPASALQLAGKTGAGSSSSALGIGASEKPAGSRCVSLVGFVC